MSPVRVAVAGLALLATAAALPACTPARAQGATVVRLGIHWSHFSAESVTVRRGVPVRFVVVNDDPIGHELIVGDQGVQDRHEAGTEKHHGARATERDVPAGSTVETTIVFPTAGLVFFACHLPGHYAYGMHGDIHVA
jgi:uncharacterized cupredoxin-like copper-binding protein